jgi:hypothetical protein
MAANSIYNSGGANLMSFGQHGCAHSDAAAALTPPDGLVIVAIQFIAANTLSALVADDATKFFNTVSAAHDGGAGEGGGGVQLSSCAFPAGITIYGRWTSVTPEADNDGGIICYFGP